MSELVKGRPLFCYVNKGVAIYTSKELNALDCEELSLVNATDFEESVWCYFTNANSQRVLVGCIYIEIPVPQKLIIKNCIILSKVGM